MMRPPRSTVPLAVLSAVTLVLLFGRADGNDGERPGEVVEPVVRDNVNATASVDRLALARPRRGEDATVVDLFAGRSWTPPPPPMPATPVAPAPPPRPSAPALPYAYKGRVEADDEKTIVYLARGDRLVAASVGDVVDQIYRLDALSEEEIVFVFIPLDQKQVLRLDGGPR
jgi:hypothetical protein